MPRIQTQALVFAEQALLPTASPEVHVVDWTCISLVTTEVGHLFECLLATRTLENSLFNSFTCLMIICSLAIQYIFWILISCQMTSWHSFFFSSRACCSTLVLVSSAEELWIVCSEFLSGWCPFSESPCLCLDLQASLLHFPSVGSVFQVLYKCPWCFFFFTFFFFKWHRASLRCSLVFSLWVSSVSASWAKSWRPTPL